MNDLPAARELVRKKREERLSVQQKKQDWHDVRDREDREAEEDERLVAEDDKSSARQQTGASADDATARRESRNEVRLSKHFLNSRACYYWRI